MERWLEAEECFVKCLTTAEKSGKPARLTEAKRHMALCKLHNGDFSGAYTSFEEARNEALAARRADLPWFTHGLVLSAFKLKKTWLFLLHLVWTETWELMSVRNKEKNELAKKAWLRSLLSDWAKLFGL